jgi:hypothetical protein
VARAFALRGMEFASLVAGIWCFWLFAAIIQFADSNANKKNWRFELEKLM